MEKTLVLLKPDAVARKLMGEIISRFERKNLNISNMKMVTIPREVAEEHYAHVRGEAIFGEMIDFITSGPVLAIVIEGDRAIKVVRDMIGKTSPFESLPGTIRGDYGLHRYKNLIHASDSAESAELEIKRFFGL